MTDKYSNAVQVETVGEVVVITLNRPKQGNALAMPMYAKITAAFQAAAANKSVKAVILTGNGPFFSTGADVAEAAERAMSGEGPEKVGQNIRNYPVVLTQTLIDFPKFAVAAVNGPVVGYPAGLLGLFDMVFVAEGATYQTPFMQLGLVPEAGSSFTIPRNAGHAMAADLLFTGRKLTAAEMVNCGIASRVLPNEQFREKVVALVAGTAKSNSASSLIAAKAMLRAPMRTELARVNLREADGLVARFQSGEPMERFAAVFAELQGKKKSKL
jgi:peroxisomal 3,2-trans-enoyl-CoA isomerase